MNVASGQRGVPCSGSASRVAKVRRRCEKRVQTRLPDGDGDIRTGRGRRGCDKVSSSGSSSPSVLMEEPFEQVTTFDVASWIAADRWTWCLETETTVRPGCVVMIDIMFRRGAKAPNYLRSKSAECRAIVVDEATCVCRLSVHCQRRGKNDQGCAMAAASCRLGYHDLRSTRGTNVNERAMSPPHRMNLRLLGCKRDETAA